MHFKGMCWQGNPLSRMNFIAGILSLSLFLSLGGACSKEERQEVQRPKVVVRVKIPPQQRPLTQEKAKGEPDKKSPGATQTAALEEKQLSSSPPVEKPEDQLAVEGKAGCYKVRKGDTLFKVAGCGEVYGNSMKWPSLFRLNMHRLGGMKVAGHFQLKWATLFRLNMDRMGGVKVVEGFQHQELPEGLDLKFVTTDEAIENLTELGRKFWVVNVLSSRNPEKLVPPAITLMMNGYHMYITEAQVDGEEWMRLRAGFFKDRTEAAVEGKEIMSILNADEIWITKIEERELEEFGGY